MEVGRERSKGVTDAPRLFYFWYFRSGICCAGSTLEMGLSKTVSLQESLGLYPMVRNTDILHCASSDNKQIRNNTWKK